MAVVEPLSNIQKSSNPKKKYMVKVNYNNQTKTIHFGAEGYKDFPTYYKENKDEAENKKKAYISRHKTNEDFSNPHSAGFWTFTALRSNSRWILWEEPTVAGSLKKVLNKYPNIKLEKIE
jgi:hypothetical protein